MSDGQPAAPDTLAALLASSREGAASVEKGTFRLDWKRALDKVKRFQLTDPHRYVLEIIQGAIAGGATAVRVTTDSDDVVIEYDGTRLTATDLEHLFDYLFAQEDELLPQKQLALGVNSALALEPRFVRVEAGDGDTGHRLELTTHDDLQVTPLGADSRIDGVRVHVRDRLGWHVLADVFRSKSLEARLVVDHCRFAPVPVVLDGDDVATGLDDAVAARHDFDGALSGGLVLPAEPGGNPRIHVCMNGVEVAPLKPDEISWMDSLGVVGFVDDPGLVRNASHTDFHRDDRFHQLVTTLARNVRRLLNGFVRARLVQGGRSLTAADHHYLTRAARALLRAKNRKVGAVENALLNLPGVVELGVTDPERIELRPVWDAFADRGAVAVCKQRYNLPLEALPEGVYPVLGPAWVVEDVFGSVVDNVDALMAATELGRKNRSLREANRRPPELQSTETFVSVAIEGTGGITGELGLTDEITASIRALVAPDGDLGEPDDARDSTLVVYMNDGVPLGARWYRTPLQLAVAVLQSPEFHPDRSWTDIAPNKATAAAGHIVQAAVPRLIETLARSFGTLPPPKQLREAGAFSPVPEQHRDVMRDIGATWPTDDLARKVRGQIDHALARRRFPRDDTPALHAWPLFYTVGGDAVSLDQIGGRVAVGDRGRIADNGWRYTIAAPWGEGGDCDGLVLNLTPLQKTALERQLKRNLAHATAELESRRAGLIRDAKARIRREANMKRAELRRQKPVLPEAEYEVVVDVEVPGGAGQVGVPRLGVETSWLRPLIDGLPLAEQQIGGAFPMHAVVQSSMISADAVFEKPLTGPGYKKVEAAIDAARPALIEAFAATPAAMTQNGVRLIWQYLHALKLPRKKAFDRLPEAVADFPLLATVSGERISLRDLRAEAHEAQRKHFRCVEISPGMQETERPVVICSNERRKTVARLLGLRGNDYTDELRREMEASRRRNQPRRPPILGVSTLLAVDLEEEDFEGEVGIPAGIMGKPGDGGWVDVLIDGVPLERRNLDFAGLPLIAVVSSAKLKANAAWTHVVRNATWKRAVKALRRAADELVLRGCDLARERARDFRSPALLVAFQRMAGERFADRPGDPLHAKTKLDLAVANAPIWESVDHRDFVTLREISEAWKRTGRVWLIATGAGQLAPGRLIVRGAPGTEAALRKIYGAKVRNGRKVFERDQSAARRRAAAPPLETRLVGVMRATDVVADDGPGGLAIRGQISPPLAYAHAQDGIRVTLGVDGKHLSEHGFDHPLRAVARVDCSAELRVNDDWTGPRPRSAQVIWIGHQLSAALWNSVAAIVTEDADDVGRDHRRQLMVEALAEIVRGDGRAELRAPLMAEMLFRTVQRTLLSADELCARKDAGETIYAVSDELDEGNPLDGRLIVRADSTGLSVLEGLLGDAVVRDDERWKRELAGAARFERLLPSEPGLEAATVASLFFRRGTTSGTLGLLVPDNREPHDDSIDARSRVRLHIGGRNICDLSEAFHPAVEVWVNDDRLTPSGAFDDVDRDQVFDDVMALVGEQLPELLARAAEHWRADDADGTRLRLCRYVLDRRGDVLGAADREPGGAFARLARAPLWPCLTGVGPEHLSTAQIVDAHGAGALRTADEDAPHEVPEQGLVVAIGGAETAIIAAGLGEVDDYSETLEQLAARREFHRRPQVSDVAVAAVSPREPLLGRRSLDEPGIEGQVGVTAAPGRTIELHLFVDRRRFSVVELPAVCRAIAAVQCDDLTVSPRYDAIERDDKLEAFEQRVREALWDAVHQLAAALPDLDPARARFTRIVLADALSAARASEREEPGFRRMRDALENAPLFVDVHGQLWSLRALDDATPEGEAIRCVSGETAAVAAVPDGLVLVMDDAMWAPMSRLFHLARDDDRYLELAHGENRRRVAQTRYQLPRGALVPAEIESPRFTGTVALQAPVGDGALAIFSRGYKVEDRPRPTLVGLCGFIDGAIETDRRFTTARIGDGEWDEIERLWRERLVAAAAAAAAFSGNRGSKKWRALAAYHQLYVVEHLDELGSSMRRRRNHVLAPPDHLAPAMREALKAPTIELNDGEWVDLGTAVSGDDPLLIVSPTRVKRPPRKDARVVVGGDVTQRLLAAVIGSGNVMTVQQARDAVARARERAEKKRKKAELQKAKRAATAHTRTLSALKSLLRETSASQFPLAVIKKMRLESGGRRKALATYTDGAVTVNRDHALWQTTVAAELDNVPNAVRHLAVALVGFLAADQGPFGPDAAVNILTRLAR